MPAPALGGLVVRVDQLAEEAGLAGPEALDAGTLVAGLQAPPRLRSMDVVTLHARLGTGAWHAPPRYRWTLGPLGPLILTLTRRLKG